MPRDNQLEGMKCPNCGNTDVFEIRAEAFLVAHADGVGDYSVITRNGDNPCTCPKCYFSGKVSEFRKD
jgi:predicted RNA-binding Zn-ribbon protein involved in translation (DUF1610 family)